jgi:phage-related protein
VPREKGHAAGSAGETHAVHYRDARGRQPVRNFIDSLSMKPAKKIEEQIEEHLNGQRADAPPPNFPITSQIEGELRELRVRFGGRQYRILYQRSENLIVLLHGFEKNTDAVPASAKASARWRMADFKKRMDATPRSPPRPAGSDAP